VADAARDEAHEDFAGARFVELDRADRKRRTELFEDCGSDLHRADPTYEHLDGTQRG
jgi:hypothetical protein